MKNTNLNLDKVISSNVIPELNHSSQLLSFRILKPAVVSLLVIFWGIQLTVVGNFSAFT